MHIRSLTFGDMRISITLYTSVIYNNVIRTFLLTIVNIISAAFIFTVRLIYIIYLFFLLTC